MYGGRYQYGPRFRRRGHGWYPGARGFWGGPHRGGWCRYWHPWDAPYYGAPHWDIPYEAGAAGSGPSIDEGEWLKAEAAELRAEAEAIKNELAHIERRLAEIERSEET